MLLPPEHVLSAFHAEANFRQIRGEVLGPEWDHGIKVGDVVYARANEWSGWSAKVREKMSLAGARVVRPVLTTDARYTAAGWKANQYVPGQLRGRVDETAQMALRLNEAMSTVPLPNVGQRDDVFARAERAAWDETGEAYSDADLAGIPVGIAHVDVLGTTIFADTNPPALVDVVPSAAPVQLAGAPRWSSSMASSRTLWMTASATALGTFQECPSFCCVPRLIAVTSITCTRSRRRPRVRTLKGLKLCSCPGHLKY